MVIGALMIRIIMVSFIILSGAALAEPDRSLPPPPLPEEQTGEDFLTEPEVNIIQRDDRTIEEYRVNGQLRYIKVIPKRGRPYYFVDTNGDGALDQQFDSLENPPVNQWILWSW